MKPSVALALQRLEVTISVHVIRAISNPINILKSQITKMSESCSFCYFVLLGNFRHGIGMTVFYKYSKRDVRFIRLGK